VLGIRQFDGFQMLDDRLLLLRKSRHQMLDQFQTALIAASDLEAEVFIVETQVKQFASSLKANVSVIERPVLRGFDPRPLLRADIASEPWSECA
jgi:hypothetical protein